MNMMSEEGAPLLQYNREDGVRQHHFSRVGKIVVLLLTIPAFCVLCWLLSSLSRTSDISVELVLRSAPLIDGHSDFPIWIRAFYQNHIYQENFTATEELYGQVDLPRLQQGGLRAQFWSVYVECPKASDNFEDEVYYEIVHDTFQQIDLVRRLVERYPSYLINAYSASDIHSNFASSNRISSLLGVEGLHQIGNSASILRNYHALGVRYVTLTHTCHNLYADSASPTESLYNGLSARGQLIVHEMNRIGMMIDLSHTNAATMRDVLSVSKAPVMFSHSNAWAVCPHERNVPDDVLLSLKKNRGIIMITFYPEFTACENEENASLKNVADHIEYVGKLIGYCHVGIGSDFDGMAYGPRGLEDVSKYPALIEELIKRGLSLRDLKGIVGDNLLRVFRDVELVAERMKDLKPLEDDVKPFFG